MIFKVPSNKSHFRIQNIVLDSPGKQFTDLFLHPLSSVARSCSLAMKSLVVFSLFWLSLSTAVSCHGDRS